MPTTKLLPPQQECLNLGTIRLYANAESNGLDRIYHQKLCLKNSGPVPWSALRVMHKALKSIRFLTGSQWRRSSAS